TVTAGAHNAEIPNRTIDQFAVIIADLDAETPLAEIPARRIRRLEAGEVQNANIDGSHGDEGRLASRLPGDRQPDLHGRTRTHRLRRVDFHRMPALTGIDGQPLQAERARGHALRLQI